MQYTAEEIEQMEFGIWLDNGVKRGWITHKICATHDSLPISAEEKAAIETGADVCMNIVRVWR